MHTLGFQNKVTLKEINVQLLKWAWIQIERCTDTPTMSRVEQCRILGVRHFKYFYKTKSFVFVSVLDMSNIAFTKGHIACCQVNVSGKGDEST